MRARAFACALLLCFASGCGGDDDDENKSPPPTTMKPPAQGWKAAVGDGGILLETFDDASWDVRKVADRDLYAVSCIDNEVGWVVGEGGFIGHTRDAGWSWPAQSSGVTRTLRAVSFAFDASGAEIGFAVGDAGTLVKTRDGGETWQRVSLDVTETLRGTAIAEDARLLLAVGDAGRLVRSSDGSDSFAIARIDGAADLTDVALDAAGDLALAADTGGELWVSRDRGLSFRREHVAGAALDSVSLGRSGALASAAGAGVALLRSRDGSWRDVAGVSLPLHATLVAPGEDRAYFAGEDGALLETVDGGRSLLRVQADTQATLRGVEDLEAR